MKAPVKLSSFIMSEKMGHYNKSDIWEVLGTMGAYVRRSTYSNQRISKGLFEKVGFRWGQPTCGEKKEWSYYADRKKNVSI